MRFVLLLALASGIADAGPAETPYPKDAPAVWDKLFNAHDAADLAAQYSESVESMPFNAPAVRGRKAMQAEFARFFELNEKARHETNVVELLMGDGWAIERASYTLTFTPKGSNKEIVETGRHVVCRKMEGTDWLIAWELWNTDQPAR